MPKTRRAKPIYQRGEFRLYPRSGRNHEIVWYDERGKRERCRSAGTTDKEQAKRALDQLFVKEHGGVPCCPTCKRPIDQRGEPVGVLIANYLETKPDGDAVHPRLAHVLDFIDEDGRAEDPAESIDEQWAQGFRDWMDRRNDRQRAPGTIENSLIQLAAALRLGGVMPAFRPIPTIEVNRSPHYRASIADIAKMFRYCLEPKGRSEKEVARRRRERENLLRFLRASVATWGRPDAVHDISTNAERRQWFKEARVLALNPDGRRQTRKRRAVVPIARQFAPQLDECSGFYVTADSVKSAWESMAVELQLPGAGQAGMKLIRRSIMTLARARIGEEHWIQGRMMAGHVKATVSDIYALPDPANLGRALAVTEAIIDEIEVACPGAFYRSFTADGTNVVSIATGVKR
jgi:hypothetical protein